jgi:hypothetical protein
MTGALLCQCGCRLVTWVHGHGQCQNCKRNVFPCCSGEVADGLPGAAGNDFAYSDRNYPDVQNDRAVIANDVAAAVSDSETHVHRHFYADNGDRAMTSPRPCLCSGLLDLAYCGICGTANICESEPDVDDVVKAA